MTLFKKNKLFSDPVQKKIICQNIWIQLLFFKSNYLLNLLNNLYSLKFVADKNKLALRGWFTIWKKYL